jgi:sRNA-binding protein
LCAIRRRDKERSQGHAAFADDDELAAARPEAEAATVQSPERKPVQTATGKAENLATGPAPVRRREREKPSWTVAKTRRGLRLPVASSANAEDASVACPTQPSAQMTTSC